MARVVRRDVRADLTFAVSIRRRHSGQQVQASCIPRRRMSDFDPGKTAGVGEASLRSAFRLVTCSPPIDLVVLINKAAGRRCDRRQSQALSAVCGIFGLSLTLSRPAGHSASDAETESSSGGEPTEDQAVTTGQRNLLGMSACPSRQRRDDSRCGATRGSYVQDHWVDGAGSRPAPRIGGRIRSSFEQTY